MMFKAHVYFWPYETGTDGYHKKAVIFEAEDREAAWVQAKELMLTGPYFGYAPERVETASVAPVTLPYFL